MGIHSDKWIRDKAIKEHMIEPFAETCLSQVISYGLSSYGYDMRVADEYKIFTDVFNTLVDPKNFNEKSFVEYKGEFCIIPPHSFALARSYEKYNIPRDCMAIVLGKSTYARCGIIVNVTPLEAMWSGFVTVEISNTTPLPVKIYSNEGIAQVLFFQGEEPCEVSYADKHGKYMDQVGIVLPKIKNKI